MGIHQEVRKLFGSSVINYIISARTAQGFEDAKTVTTEERREIIGHWTLHKDEYQSEKQKIVDLGGPEGQGTGHLTPKGFLQTRHLSFDERKKLHADRKLRREEEAKKVRGDKKHPNCPFCRRSTAHNHAPVQNQLTAAPDESTTTLLDGSAESEDEFEAAIKASVAATSRGNADEDAMIERAIRASVRELYAASGPSDSDHDALSRAIKASIAEAENHRKSSQQGGELGGPAAITDEEAEHQVALEKAIQESLLQYQARAGGDVDEDAVQSEDDEDLKKALALSRELSKAKGKQVADDEGSDAELKLAIQKSKESVDREKTEEEVVLEYVKKQSLLEQELAEDGQRGRPREAVAELQGDDAVAKKTEKSKGEKEKESQADEEALRLAIEESMKGAGGGRANA